LVICVIAIASVIGAIKLSIEQESFYLVTLQPTKVRPRSKVAMYFSYAKAAQLVTAS
jgi:hypothetical protein